MVFYFKPGLFHFYCSLSLILSTFLDCHRIPSRAFVSIHSRLDFVAHIRQFTAFWNLIYVYIVYLVLSMSLFAFVTAPLMKGNHYIDTFVAMQMVSKYYKNPEKNLKDIEYPSPEVIDWYTSSISVHSSIFPLARYVSPASLHTFHWLEWSDCFLLAFGSDWDSPWMRDLCIWRWHSEAC